MTILGVTASSINKINGAFDSIQTISASAATTITFSSIPQTYQHLQLRINMTNSASTATIRMQFNGVSTGYNFFWLYASGSTRAAQGTTSSTGIFLIGNAVNVQSSTQPTAIIIDLHDYANTTRTKTVKSMIGLATSTPSGVIDLNTGFLNATAAISSITIQDIAGPNFTGSFALYGIKGT